MDTISNRLKSYMEINSLRQTDILDRCKPYCEKYDVKLSKSMLSEYISGAYIPKQKKIFVLALGMNVSESWLMGLDVPMERENTETEAYKLHAGNIIGIAAKDPNAIRLLEDYQKLNADNRDKLLQFADALTLLP